MPKGLESLQTLHPTPAPSTPSIRPMLVLSTPPESRPRALVQSRKSLLYASECQDILSLAQEAPSGGRENSKERWQGVKRL
ncbi:hypothetical protein JB92DRAFT_2869825 [Gautieria morchelliformis]|nr:hypothetical protein JB92DRAFT_2869825 [Gautieria morchelliformis]